MTIFWIVDIVTGATLSGGLQESEVSQFIQFDTAHHNIENLVIRTDGGREWSAKTWQKERG